MFPLLLAIAAAVRLTSRDPALFWQERIGPYGRRIKTPKFRTMVDSAEAQREVLMPLNEHDGPLFKMRHDFCRTPLGCWLRRFSPDELPQLWNVVTGEMSLVGPRPPLPEEVDRYGDDVRQRLLVKPGSPASGRSVGAPICTGRRPFDSIFIMSTTGRSRSTSSFSGRRSGQWSEGMAGADSGTGHRGQAGHHPRRDFRTPHARADGVTAPDRKSGRAKENRPLTR